MSRKLILCLSVAFALTAAWADSTWIGTVYSGEQGPGDSEWSDPKNWEGGVPTGDDRAILAMSPAGDRRGNGRALALTPPLAFTGTVVCNSDDDPRYPVFPTMVKLTVLPGATWRVAGNGHLYVTEGIAERLSPDFTGVIALQNGGAFVASATLNDAVEFVGDGTLTLTKASQLAHISGFVGTVVWAGDGEIKPGDTTLLQGRTVLLGGGAKFDCAGLTSHAARSIPGFEAAGAWQFNGGTPAVSSRGELKLITDDGAPQIRSAVFTQRLFQFTDVWGVHFTCKAGPRAAGSLGVFMASETTKVGFTLDRPVPAWPDPGYTTASGFSVQLPGHCYWWAPDKDYGGLMKGEGVDALGATFDYAQAITYDVAYQGGRLTVTMSQGGKTLSTQRSMYADPRVLGYFPQGFYLAIGASGENGTECTLEDFRGWYRVIGDGAWSSVGEATDFYPITADKWVARQYANGGQDVSEGAAAINPDGSFSLQPAATYRRTVLGSKVELNWRNCYLVDFDLCCGAGGGEATGYTERLNFGFTLTPKDGSGTLFPAGYPIGWNDLDKAELLNFNRPYMVNLNCYAGLAHFYCYSNFWTSAEGDIWALKQSADFPWLTYPQNTTIHVQMLYDGTAESMHLLATAPEKMATDFKWMPPAGTFSRMDWGSSMYLTFTDYTTWGYVETIVRNVTVRELSGGTSSDFTGTLAVAPGAKAEFAADAFGGESGTPAVTVRKVELAADAELDVTSGVEGSEVVLGSVVASGGAYLVAQTPTKLMPRIEFTGEAPGNGLRLQNVTLVGDALTLVVPARWRTGRVSGTLLDFADSDISIDVSKARVLTEDGRDVTRRCNLTVTDDRRLMIDFNVGLAFILR